MAKKSEDLWTTVTPAEMEEIRRAAQALGVPIAGFVRSGIYRQLRAVRDQLDPDDLRREARLEAAREATIVKELETRELVQVS